MSAIATDMSDFIEALRREVPEGLRPSAASDIGWLFTAMRHHASDPAEISKLMEMVRFIVAREEACCE